MEFLLLLLFVLFLATLKPQKAHSGEIPEGLKNFTPKEALEELIAGNKRYALDISENGEENAIRRKHTALHGQFPFATVLACSDARMPVETLLDQGNGDLFVIRVAGNIVGDQVLGSIDFSITNLNIPLLVVLGHTQCGAIYSSVDDIYSQKSFTPNEERLLAPLFRLAMKQCYTFPDPTETELIIIKENIIEANVLKEMSEIIRSSAVVRQRLRSKELMLVGAVYNITTGKVDWLGPREDEDSLVDEIYH